MKLLYNRRTIFGWQDFRMQGESVCVSLKTILNYFIFAVFLTPPLSPAPKATVSNLCTLVITNMLSYLLTDEVITRNYKVWQVKCLTVDKCESVDIHISRLIYLRAKPFGTFNTLTQSDYKERSSTLQRSIQQHPLFMKTFGPTILFKESIKFDS